MGGPSTSNPGVTAGSVEGPLGAPLTVLVLVAFAFAWVPMMWRSVIRRERWPGRRLPPDLLWRTLIAIGFGAIRIGYGFIVNVGTWLDGDARNGNGPLIPICYVLTLVVGPAFVVAGLWLGAQRLREHLRRG